jgi:hypothetical protein
MQCASCVANWPSGQPFPPKRFPARIDAILAEILEERCVSSRGRRIPRGVKRKMSGYALRRGRVPSQPTIFAVKIRASSK